MDDILGNLIYCTVKVHKRVFQSSKVFTNRINKRVTYLFPHKYRLLEVPLQSHGVIKKFCVLELSLHVQDKVHSQVFGLQRQLHLAGLSTLGAANL